MALAVVSSSTPVTTLTGTLTLTPPATITDNNVLVMGVSAAQTGAINTPSGWSVAVAKFTGSGGSNLAVFYKIAASESGNYTVTGSTYLTGSIVNISGNDTTTPIDVAGTGSGGTGTTATAAAITIATANALLLYFSGSDGNGALGIPSGWTSTGAIDGSGGAEGYSSGYDPTTYSTGTTGTKSATAQTPWSAVLVAIRPSGGSDVTVALTGTSTTTAVGVLLTATSVALNGQGITSSAGTLTPVSGGFKPYWALHQTKVIGTGVI